MTIVRQGSVAITAMSPGASTASATAPANDKTLRPSSVAPPPGNARTPVVSVGSSKPPPCLFMGIGTETRSATAAPVAVATQVAAPRTAQAAQVAPAGAHALRPQGGAAAAGLEVGEVTVSAWPFDPSQPSTRSQLIAQLSAGPTATIQEMRGFRGGLNEGVWFLSDPASDSQYVLKLVRGSRLDQSLLTESENFQKIAREYPAVTSDPAVAFPVRVLAVVGPAGAKKLDLIVMRRARGERLAEVIARKWYGGQVQALMHVLEKTGLCLGEFHARYGGVQHGDFQPSNLLYDEERDSLVMIDVGGMGVPTTVGDVAHFSNSVRLLAETYGASLCTDGLRRFEQGYARASAAKK